MIVRFTGFKVFAYQSVKLKNNSSAKVVPELKIQSGYINIMLLTSIDPLNIFF